MKENWGRKEAVSISGRDVERIEWGRHRPGVYTWLSGRPAVSPLGRHGDVGSWSSSEFG